MTVQLTRGRLRWINGCCNRHHTLASCILMRHQSEHAPVSGTGSLPQQASDASRQDFKDVTSERAAVLQPIQKLALQGELLPNGAPSPAKTTPKLQGSPRASSAARKSEGKRSQLLRGPGNPLPQPRGGARRPRSKAEGELNPAFNPLLFSWQAPGSQEAPRPLPRRAGVCNANPSTCSVQRRRQARSPRQRTRSASFATGEKPKQSCFLVLGFFFLLHFSGCFSWGRAKPIQLGQSRELAWPRRTPRLRKIRDPHLMGGILFFKP